MCKIKDRPYNLQERRFQRKALDQQEGLLGELSQGEQRGSRPERCAQQNVGRQLGPTIDFKSFVLLLTDTTPSSELLLKLRLVLGSTHL